ncbi:pyrroline-5-carboxylate reductase [Saccharibacter sp. 17.LH.SD]|uniref:pyrroline-5-carboxylate reductase n=1 Tax=Saccharibacter sp. 17.LH.SD TaxID=2689393 RepID=UPI00136A0912|nr:pyrroline-5-carboxylate reductase [Saccharibacter sp. 17.LH.SD]MXV43685.1 pyrroline-5-carboxylate reductase [Saccharibacter sp. 17.LH.SD]
MTSPTLLLVGCGKMGGALAQGWMNSPKPPRLVILDRKLEQAPGNSPIYRTPQDIPKDVAPDIIVLAIKPAAADSIIKELSAAMGENFYKAALLSVMAGKTCQHLAEVSGREDMPVIRTMPNTPSSVGAGSAGLYASPHVSEKQKALGIALMEQVGTVVPVSRETDLRTVTAIAGSAPAYIFFLAELLEQRGVDLGLTAKQSRQLVRSMIYGSGKMLHDLPEDAATLRKNVTSPNGTTAAALSVFMDERNWPHSVKLATEAAVRRAEELDN